MGINKPYYVVAAGIDTLRVNARGKLRWDVRAMLEQLQAEALEERNASRGRKRSRVLVETSWRLAGQPLMIRPHGGGNAQWRWLLTCPAATFELGMGELNGICGRVRLSSEFLWRLGYRRAWNSGRAVFKDWADETSEQGQMTFQVGELHLCADVAGLMVDTLRREEFVHRGAIVGWHEDDVERMHLVERAKAAGEDRPMVDVYVRHGETEGISFSKGAPHSAGIYNKPREIRFKSRDKIWFADIWRRGGWDGVAPITRVEMRYLREALRDLGCEGVAETFERLDALWAYSTQKWLRHTMPQANDHKNRSRWPDSPWWQTVRSADYGKPSTAPAARRKAHVFHEKRILSAILGYLESWAAYTAEDGVDPSLDISTVLREIGIRSSEHYCELETDFYREVLDKRKRLGYPQ